MKCESGIVEIEPPDVTPYRRGNTGVDYVTTFDSGRPGPEVVINGLMHGNELCGAIAIDAIFRQGLRPSRGRLSLSLANIAAYQAFDRTRPYANRFVDEDMNRIWSPETLGARRRSLELSRARALWPIFAGADVILDLHSMSSPGDPLVLCGPTERGRDFARRLGYPLWVVRDHGHPNGRRLIDHPALTLSGGTQTALLVECGSHWRASTAATALEVAVRLLRRLDMIDPDTAAPYLVRPSEEPKAVEVTDVVVAAGDSFEFTRPFEAITLVPEAGTVIATDGGRAVCTPYDRCVLVLPAPRGVRGHVAVRLGRLVA